MLYKQFANILDEVEQAIVKKFDYWLATLSPNNQRNITASVVSTRLDIKYSIAEKLLGYSEKAGILEKYYLVKCPECDYILEVINIDDIDRILSEKQYCDECEEDRIITTDDIYIAYKVIMHPDICNDELEKIIDKKLGENNDTNFFKAGSLSEYKLDLYKAYYNPSESAYNDLNELRRKLDIDYKNTTDKGKALEKLVLELFNNIKMVSGTNEIKTQTNQFDCTFISGIKTIYPSVFSYLSPYFIIECKNEPEKKPDNTYCNKLIGIMNTNDAQIGIVFGRIDATSTCHTISRENYLKNYNSNKQKIILTFSDNDLDYLLDEKVNLLNYLEFKILNVTANTKNATYEIFLEKNNKSNNESNK